MMMALNPIIKRIVPLGCLFMGCLLSGCGPINPSFNTDTVSLRVDMDANNDSAIAVDVVVAYDDTLFKEILALPADKYFLRAKQYRLDYPQALDIFHWEVVPGQFLPSERLKYRRTMPVGAVLFARYIAPGDHRRRLGSEQFLEVHLMKESFLTYGLGSDNASLKLYKEAE